MSHGQKKEGRLVFCPQKSPRAYSRERGIPQIQKKRHSQRMPRARKRRANWSKKVHQNRPHFFSCFSAVWLRGTPDTFLGPPSREVWLQGVLLRLTGPMPRLCHKTPVSIIVPDIRTTDTTSKREERKGACLPPVPHIKMRDIYFSPFIVFLRRAE